MSEEEVLEADPVEDGQDAEVDEAELGELSEFDIEQYRNQTVVVKVDGEDVRVPLSEALAGYQRQADYSRKTQALAAEKKDLQWASAIRGALDTDPAGTIRLLADHYGITQAQAAEMVGADDPSAEVDPRYAQLQSEVNSLKQERAEENLRREIASLQGKYGEDFDAQEVVAAAFKSGSRDLEATYKLIAFDRMQSKQAADKAAAKTKAAKQEAGVVSGGSSAKGGEADSPIRSISDAWHAAKREHQR